MATTEYVLFSRDFADGYDEKGELAEWRCGVCRRADGEDTDTDEASHYITVCEHVVRGDETHTEKDEYPGPGSVEIAYDQGKPGDRPSWQCSDDECGEVALCHDCWSNL